MLNTRNLAARLMIGSVLLGGGLFLAGCSADASSSTAASAAGGPAKEGAPANGAAGVAAAAPSAASRAAAQGGTGSTGAGSTGTGSTGLGTTGTGTTARLAPASSIIYTAQLTVRAADVGAAAAQAARIAEGAGGYIASETISANPDHPSQATGSVQLKIPVAAYPATLGQLGRGLGTQLSLEQQAQDVTQRVADVNSQVASAQAAIAQLRALLSHAGSVGDLLSVQNQINGEESVLESMQAQQRALGHETTYATVTLTLLGPKAKPAVHPRKPPPSLAGGFGAGWHALRVTVSWTLAFLGAVAPFAAILAVAGFAVYRARRWLARRKPAGPAAPAATPEG